MYRCVEPNDIFLLHLFLEVMNIPNLIIFPN